MNVRKQENGSLLPLLNFLGNFYFALWNIAVALGFFFVVAVLFWISDVFLFLGPFSFACGSFITEMPRKDSKREILTLREKAVSTCLRNIIFSAYHASYPFSFMMMCYDAQRVRLACNGFVTPTQLWVFRFPFSTFVTLNLCFALPVLRKRLQCVVSVVRNQYLGCMPRSVSRCFFCMFCLFCLFSFWSSDWIAHNVVFRDLHGAG